MPAIQAMRSDALAARSKEDIQEKIPSFFNSVNQALGQNVITGQDAAEQLLDSRFTAANAIAAQIRQKVDGQGALAELAAGAGMKLISSLLDTVLLAFSKTNTTDAIQVLSDIAMFMLERATLRAQWEAVAATYAQWIVQAGYGGQGDLFDDADPAGSLNALGGRGALKYRDALTPRWTSQTVAPTASANGFYQGSNLAGSYYTQYYDWGSVGSISRVGQPTNILAGISTTPIYNV